MITHPTDGPVDGKDRALVKDKNGDVYYVPRAQLAGSRLRSASGAQGGRPSTKNSSTRLTAFLRGTPGQGIQCGALATITG